MIQKNGPNTPKKSTFIYIKKSGIYLICVLLLFVAIGISTTIAPAYRFSSDALTNWTSEIEGSTFLHLLGMENRAFQNAYPEDKSVPKLSTMLFHMATSIKPNDPRSLLGNEIPGFSKFGAQIIVAGEGTTYADLPVESSPPIDEILKDREAIYDEPAEDKTEKPNENDNGEHPSTGNRDVVLIYNTHNTESFKPYLPDVTNMNLVHHSKVNITKVSDRLAKALEANGIGTHVDHTNIANEVNARGWNYTDSYKASREVVQAAISSNKDLQYIFDIHRDGDIDKEDETIKINGENYARIFFIVGAGSDNYTENLKLATKLDKLIEKKYPGLSRGVIAKTKKEGNGVYNQDLSNNSLLIEFGGVHSKFEELYRTADAVADVFSEYYWDAEKVNAETEEEN